MDSDYENKFIPGETYYITKERLDLIVDAYEFQNFN